jgi:hypothetical protein
MKDCVYHFERLFSSTTVAVGAPVTGGGIGIVSIIEGFVPLLTIISLIIGITIGIMSYRLKRKLINRQLRDIEEHPHEHKITLED